jgi:integrase
MSDWQTVGENLVRHPAGNIYVRIRVDGKQKRISLGTKDARIAKIKRDSVLPKLRISGKKQSTSGSSFSARRTVGDAIQMLESKVVTQANLEEPTVKYYKEIFGVLRDTLDCEATIKSMTPSTMSKWWRAVARRYSSQRANNVLGIAKRLGKMLVQKGLILEDPWAELHRVKIEEKIIHAVSADQIEALVNDIRNQKKVHSEESSDFVAFLAFSGCRLGQAQALLWKDIEANWIVFRSGVSGSKGAATRQLPISPRLRAVLDRMERGKPHEKVFSVSSPHEALRRACKRLNMPHLRIHDLRHFFATWAMECGINVRIVAGWLGHKDGGVLLLRRYAHMREAHSLEAAANLK